MRGLNPLHSTPRSWLWVQSHDCKLDSLPHSELLKKAHALVHKLGELLAQRLHSQATGKTFHAAERVNSCRLYINRSTCLKRGLGTNLMYGAMRPVMFIYPFSSAFTFFLHKALYFLKCSSLPGAPTTMPVLPFNVLNKNGFTPHILLRMGVEALGLGGRK